MELATAKKIIEGLPLPELADDLTHGDAYDMLRLLIRWHRRLDEGYADLARALRAVIAAEVTSNNWSWMVEQVEDYELLNALKALMLQHERDERYGRSLTVRRRTVATPLSQILDKLAETFFLCNPLMEELSGLYKIMHGGDGKSQATGPMNYVSKSENSYRIFRSNIRKQQAALNERVRGYDPTTQKFPKLGKREMRSKLPPIDINGKEYFQTVECRMHGHQLSPLYRFHAHAWGLRIYAQALEDAGMENCPFLSQEPELFFLTVENLRAYNRPSASNYYRWMMEVEEFIDRRKEASHARRRKLSEKEHGIYLPVYYDIVLPSGNGLTLCAPVSQQLPDKLIKLMRTEAERKAAWAFQRHAMHADAQPCTIGELNLWLDREKLKVDYPGERLPTLRTPKPAVAETRLRRINPSMRDPDYNPNASLPPDFEPSHRQREGMQSLLDNIGNDPELGLSNNQPLDAEENV